MKIAIACTGYVGLSMAVALYIVSAKVDMINQRQTPIHDVVLQDYLAH